MSNELDNQDWDEIRKQPAVRQTVSSQSFNWFFHLYFGHYIQHATADFQREMMELAGQESIEHLIIMAFRGSGKSTIITTALPLWAIMGKLQKKYVVIVSQTQNQAQQHLKNIAIELSSNELIAKDFMPYDFEDTELGVSAINLPKFGARIIAVSREQGVRGLRFGPHRPDLIIADDVEDTNAVKTREARNKNFDWFTGELIPLGSENTKYITIGNLLHEDSLLMRLKQGITNGSRSGRFLEYPLAVDNVSLWPSRYPDIASVKAQERKVGNPITWQREYMLHLVPDDDQIITRSMIHTYPEMPALLSGQYHRKVAGVDLAIAENDKADYTAIVSLDIRGRKTDKHIYVQPHPFNKRIGFPETVQTLTELYYADNQPTFYIEQVAYQAAVVQQLQEDGLDAKGVAPKGDKRSRLSMISARIANGTILFPEHGCEELIAQLIGFSVEKHDDLVDALTMAVLEYGKEEQTQGTVTIVSNSALAHRIHNPGRSSNRGRNYWNRRLDDFNEATSGNWS